MLRLPNLRSAICHPTTMLSFAEGCAGKASACENRCPRAGHSDKQHGFLESKELVVEIKLMKARVLDAERAIRDELDKAYRWQQDILQRRRQEAEAEITKIFNSQQFQAICNVAENSPHEFFSVECDVIYQIKNNLDEKQLVREARTKINNFVKSEPITPSSLQKNLKEASECLSCRDKVYLLKMQQKQISQLQASISQKQNQYSQLQQKIIEKVSGKFQLQKQIWNDQKENLLSKYQQLSAKNKELQAALDGKKAKRARTATTAKKTDLPGTKSRKVQVASSNETNQVAPQTSPQPVTTTQRIIEKVPAQKVPSKQTATSKPNVQTTEVPKSSDSIASQSHARNSPDNDKENVASNKKQKEVGEISEEQPSSRQEAEKRKKREVIGQETEQAAKPRVSVQKTFADDQFGLEDKQLSEVNFIPFIPIDKVKQENRNRDPRFYYKNFERRQ